jgi:hypothetical protein
MPHTPSPLTVKTASNGDCAVIKFDEKQCIVAECYAAIRYHDEDSRDEALANARLYAAAPDMLAALKELEPLWPLQQMTPQNQHLPYFVVGRMLRDVIAKAEGREG